MRRERSTEQMKMAGSKSSSSFCSRRNVCHCGEDAMLMTSKTGSNLGKKFWRCPNWNRKSCCWFLFGLMKRQLREEETRKMSKVKKWKSWN
ncbi:Zinc finger, GRF-type [Sesbania bispinosa]|nr:Zinc finger, GRF-type [Sesbania bispinosa]